MTTPLCQKHGWLCCKEFEKTMTRSASHSPELGLLAGCCCNCLSGV